MSIKNTLAKLFRRINQVVLVFPVWLVIGMSGFFRNYGEQGWRESEDEENYGRMF